MAAADGTVRLGAFRILERLGEGGMCIVFRARKDGDERDCALKVLRDDAARDAKVRDLFATEAEVSQLLDHPNLMRTHEAGQIDGRAFIAMELVEGATLARLVQTLQARQLPLPPDLALFVVTEVLDGLHALHEATLPSGEALGLVHRDVTPDNVFVGFDGRVLLGDFGVTHVQAFGDSSPHHAVGKLGYFAPESLGNERIDRRADVFSAGVMLFELLTGRRLFEAEDDERTLAQMADARVPPLHRYVPEIDRELAAIVARALAKRPRDRFETAEDLAVELEPHWSKAIANPPALDALVAATFPAEARAWAVRHTPGTLETVDLSWPTG